MTFTEAQLLPYLFMILMGFIVLNLAITFTLYLNSKKDIYKFQAIYWFLNIFTSISIPLFDGGNNLQICISQMLYFVVLVMINKMSALDYDLVLRKKTQQYRNFYLFHGAMIALTVLVEMLFQNFTLTAIPTAISLSSILLKTSYEVLIKNKNISSPYNKTVGVFCILFSIHAFNFAIFRLEPGTQIFGWSANMVFFTVFALMFSAQGSYAKELDEKKKLNHLVGQRTAQLSQQNKVLQNLADSKSRLFKMLIHDISSPLMTSRLILESSLKRETVDLDKITSASQKLGTVSDIIRQVIELEKHRAGKSNLDFKATKVAHITKKIIEAFKIELANKNISFNIVNFADEDTSVLIDETIFINTIIGNLITNAIKFSYQGSNITMTIDTVNKYGTDQLVIKLQDQGVGIEKNKLQYLFDFNHPTSTKGTNGEQGTGFGLPLASFFIKDMNGTIEVKSQRNLDNDNSGTEFKVSIPELTKNKVIIDHLSSTETTNDNNLSVIQ